MDGPEQQPTVWSELKIDSFEHVEELQSLWGDYGTLYRVEYEDERGEAVTAILKHIRLSTQSKRERSSASHRRKHQSYLVEIEWYKRYSQLCDGTCRVPALLASHISDDSILILLEDLDAAGFPMRRVRTSEKEMDACLFWLANFHATFLNTRPDGLWKIGTYWHLGTRAEEYEQMPRGKLKKRAHKLDKALNSARYLTFVHGDAKPENFCFSREGWVAAVDFQYVGRGCGMKDLAYLLWGSSGREEADMRQQYFEHLQAAMRTRQPEVDFEALRSEWTELYPLARDDFKRFLEGWLPSNR